MREILFRGFHKDENGKETIYLNGKEIKGNWVYGDLIQLFEGRRFIIDNKFVVNEVIPETISQYTGLDDKNGKKIFECDIVKSILILENNIFILNIDVVEFNKEDCSFMLGKGKRHFNNNLDLEVIGTIFDEKEVE